MKSVLMMGAVVVFCVGARCHAADSVAQSRSPRVLLDCYFNNEWKTDSVGHRWRYHYVWSDTLDSGFSQLGSIVRSCGGTIDTICRAPTDGALSAADIYLIVDPDTPKETSHPEYIDDTAAAVISRWVRGGGILLLFGNDSGNAEFAHFNRLAARFGISFNENSRNRVVGKNFDAGTFSALPAHPMFAGVRKIYLKEISTITVRDPAHSLLVDGGDSIIATADFGKGMIFAVGDPWFYNEYMDGRRLPAGYDNALTARNLFRWLFARVCPVNTH